MPRIGLILPGKQQKPIDPIAEEYIITVERGDGTACSPMEAQTTMSMYIIESCQKRIRKTPAKKRKQTSDVPHGNGDPRQGHLHAIDPDWPDGKPNAETLAAMAETDLESMTLDEMLEWMDQEQEAADAER
jgi:hypothetical protein